LDARSVRFEARAARMARGVPSIPAVLGRVGMELFIEPSIRRLVADGLGIRADALVSVASLRDAPAVGAAELVELTLDLEAEFAIVVPEDVIDAVRTYGDLVEAIGLLIRERRAVDAHAAELPLRVWVRVGAPSSGEGGTLHRADWLTPYVAQTIVADARRAGRGVHVEVTVAAVSTAACARVRARFARLLGPGTELTVRQDERPYGVWSSVQ
jgi:acyl carrier protein